MDRFAPRIRLSLPFFAYALVGLGTFSMLHRASAGPIAPPTRWAFVCALAYAVGATAVYVARGRSHSAYGWGVSGMALSGLALAAFQTGSAYDSAPVLAMGIIGARLSPSRLPYVAVPYALAAAYWLDTSRSLTGYVSNAVALLAAAALGRYVVSRREHQTEQARLFARLQETHAELQAAHQQLQNQAAQAEELAALRERERLAREFHDTLGHALSTITVQLEAARRVARHAPGRVDEMLAETQNLSRQAMTELRHSLSALRDAPSSDAPETALSELIEAAAARAGWTVDMDLQTISLPPEAASALRKVAAEAVANAERHAGARRVAVTLTRTRAEMELVVVDDGCGFDPSQRRSGHYGLLGMDERITSLGGRLSVESSPGNGTRVTARVPIGTDRLRGDV